MTDLTDRMRTCAAFLMNAGWVDKAVIDAADLLIEASNLIDAPPEPLGEPMELLPLPPPPTAPIGKQRSPHACPKCDSRAAKKVRRDGRQLVLACPVCATEWPWRPQAEWR